jgi:hypothetical protein
MAENFMESDMKLVYVAGPYRAKTYLGIVRNIWRAWKVAKELWRNKIAAICPHTNTVWLSEPPNNIEADCFLGGDLLMVKGCDAVLMLKNWETSTGACGELAYAREHGIPVFFNLEEVITWAKAEKTTQEKNDSTSYQLIPSLR